MDAAVKDPGRLSSALALPFLAADVGGTHARLALVRGVGAAGPAVDVLAYREYACADFSSPSELLRAFLDQVADVPVRHCVLACAGQVLGDNVIHDNLAWPIQPSRLCTSLGFDDVAVLNDFEALGYALDDARNLHSQLLCGPDTHAVGAMLVVGPGTGLGAAVHLPGAGGQVLTTEAGQMDCASQTVRERELLARLAPVGGYVPYERVVSGPGLLAIYRAVCEAHGAPASLGAPEAVTAAARGNVDGHAVAAVDVFCGLLGSFSGNLAMVFMPRGGVYLAGGFLSSMFDLLQRSCFAARFVHGRSVRTVLERVPVRVMEHGRHGVLGAAHWYLRRLAGEPPARGLATECEGVH